MDRSLRLASGAVLGLVAALACDGAYYARQSPEPGHSSESGAGTSMEPNARAGAGGTGSAGAPAGARPSALGGSDGAGGRIDRTECARAASGLAVFGFGDVLGYAPYALAECSLAYVAPDGSLRLRDLVNGDERLLEASTQSPSRPAISTDLVAWEVFVDGKSQVRVFHGDSTVTLSGAFDHAGEPRAAAGVVAFTAWSEASSTSDTDVFTYDLARGSAALAVGGTGQQRFPDVSDEYVAVTDFSEDPRGVFDHVDSIADLVLLERGTGTLVRRPRAGKQAFPLLGSDGTLVYLDWGAVHPEPKFLAYALQLGRIEAPPESDLLIREIRSDPSYARPSLRDGVIDFVDLTTAPGTLYRVRVATPDTLVPTKLEGRPLSPVTATGFTVIGTQVAAAMELRVMSH